MSSLVVQFHNIADGREADYAAYLATLPGQIGSQLSSLQRYGLSATQFPGQTSAAQPWSGATLLELAGATSDVDVARLGELIHAAPVQGGLLATERSHLFEVVRDRVPSSSPPPATEPEHIMIVMANYVPGMREAWDAWYDDVHGPEILGAPGVEAYTRGVLADVQLDPDATQPANGLIIQHFRAADFDAAITEFVARAMGTSPSGIHWASRSEAAALGRTTHGFEPVGPRLAVG
jgi:hypothetical protein